MDPFGQGTLSPSGLYQPHSQPEPTSQDTIAEQSIQQPAVPSNIPGPGPRNYKSRKYRPCDFCRARQVACKIEVSPPCQLCQSHGKECTFVERPKKKRRPKQNPTSTAESLSPASSAPDSTIAGRIGRFTLASQESSTDVSQRDFSSYTTPLDPHLTALSHDNAQGHSHNTGYLPLLEEQMYERRIDNNPQYLDHQQHPLGHVSQPLFHRSPSVHHDNRLDSASAKPLLLVGETGEANPYLLRYYHYDDKDECLVSRQTFRRVKTLGRVQVVPGSKEVPPVMFTQVDDTHYRLGEPRVDDHTLVQFQHEMAEMFTDEERYRLLGLYFRFIDPYFPIFAKSELFCNGMLNQHAIHALPLALTSVLYATALPFVQYDDLLSATSTHGHDHTARLYSIAWHALTQDAHTPRLSTVQAALLLLQRPPSSQYAGETAWKSALVGWTVSIANSLGLHRDASEWNIPVWELALRKRIWHAVVCMDKWVALGAGMPSHLRSEDVDVQLLWPSDLEASDVMDAEHHFRLLTELTTILSDITDTFFTVRATQRTCKDFALSFDLARSLRVRLREWSDSMAPYIKEELGYSSSGRHNVDHALRLAFIVANMTLLRAILRPIDNMCNMELQDQTTMQSRAAVRAGAMDCAREAVDFVEGLGRGGMDVFWHSCKCLLTRLASGYVH